MMRRDVRGLARNKEGAVAPTVALSLVALIAAGGIAFDYARMAALDTELQSAADQAALAAAGQLDGESGACARAVAAARNLFTNDTRFANDGQGIDVTIADSAVCDPNGVDINDDESASIRFFADKAATVPAENNTEARYVEVRVDTREARYALTPIVGALSSGDLKASARAGLGTALCKVPPLMVCNPTPGVAVDWNAKRGYGVQAVAQNGWTPGGFGYLGPQDANSTQIGLAYQNPVFSCQQVENESEVSTGAPAPAIAAINTRMDIYDFGGGGGSVLSPCLTGACPAAQNVVKDLIRDGTGTSGNACKIHPTQGWRLPAASGRFIPRAKSGLDTETTPIDADNSITAMGLPRDNCHYTSYGSACRNSSGQLTGRFGDGKWARADYFNKYHPGASRPADWTTKTRYDTYRWEIDNAQIPNAVATGALWQRGTPICSTGTLDSTRDRRVLQVAIGENCASLHGASGTVQISHWVEMFMVEPGVAPPGRGNGDSGNEIYLEVIREVDPGGAAAQVVRRDVPFLVH